MAKLNDLLSGRFLKKKEEASSKMAVMAEDTAMGRRNGFSGIFNVQDLPQEQKDDLREILERYASEDQIYLEQDHRSLIALTSEVRAISNQAALLHGERIKKAQSILKRYQEGAFSAWLMATYGNRQTPYNFLQYYEFHLAMPKALHSQIEKMPRQAIYTLASRDGDLTDKRLIVERYEGQTKNELLQQIRENFPLAEGDQRRRQPSEALMSTLKRLPKLIKSQQRSLSPIQREGARRLLEEALAALD